MRAPRRILSHSPIEIVSDVTGKNRPGDLVCLSRCKEVTFTGWLESSFNYKRMSHNRKSRIRLHCRKGVVDIWNHVFPNLWFTTSFKISFPKETAFGTAKIAQVKTVCNYSARWRLFLPTTILISSFPLPSTKLSLLNKDTSCQSHPQPVSHTDSHLSCNISDKLRV